MNRVFKKITLQLAESDDGVRVYCSGRYEWTIEYKEKKIRLGRSPYEDSEGFFSFTSPPSTDRRWELLDGIDGGCRTEGQPITTDDCEQIKLDFEGGLTALGERWVFRDEPIPFRAGR